MSSFDDENIARELKGNTLRVYWALLNSKDGVTGVRELQRHLGFSSPTLAAYHLNKLVELELVVTERGNYRLVREVKVGVLKQFIKLGTFLLPRYVLYATMFTIFLIFFLTRLKEVSFYSSFALMLGILSTVISWYETIRVWMQKP
ncbi:MAG: helix-turn-helix domain-containing protein [Candidatus Bathyarchaeota archaeon]|nr:helix-turn-helix domain-containing protein [Candidatus Bathyarchaeota archaeon]